MEQVILATAEKLFLEKGFDGTSTTQIAKEAGCNQALVHYYFRTKENLFNSIFETKFRTFFQNIFDTTQLTNLSFLEKIKHISRTHFDLLLANPQMPKLVINELSRRKENINILRDRLHVLPEQLFSLMDNELQEEISAGRVKNITFIDIMISIVSLNVALFFLKPVVSDVLLLTDEQANQMLQHRKEENVNIILSYLKP
ncbi:MAG: TetR/AcrR family transcriptional regulator [Paludibacter sp.]|nr:TetR/AcrR family transcriptional regulator [Paludibacter sp.]